MNHGHPFIFGVKKSKVKVTGNKTVPALVFALLRVLTFSSLLVCSKAVAATEPSWKLAQKAGVREVINK